MAEHVDNLNKVIQLGLRGLEGLSLPTAWTVTGVSPTVTFTISRLLQQNGLSPALTMTFSATSLKYPQQ